MKPKIIVIAGPTGVGKTSIAIELCRDFRGEIIGADSMQVYRLMDIGTAKPTLAQQAMAPHHMVDILRPDESFDAGRFVGMADSKIHMLNSAGKIPFVVGGTGLYIKALIHGLSRARPADAKVLQRLKEEAKEHGAESLHRRLAECDPAAAEKIHVNDLFRITRALEIFEVTGAPISHYHNEHRFAGENYRALKLGLNLDRETLYERINKRVDQMIDEGLLDEVKGLLDSGYPAGLKSMQSIGYRHMADHLVNGVPWEETCQTLKRDTRRYAKRQLTWFKADPEIKWFGPNQLEGIRKEVKKFMQI
jgi:tRNA dimethylallyltransferase